MSGIAIAIYSTSASEEDIEKTFVLGANMYIKKPSDFKKLKKVLSEVVSINWQSHQQLKLCDSNEKICLNRCCF